jgi:hypothetical protein
MKASLESDYRLIRAIAGWQPSSSRTPEHDFDHKTKAAASAVPLHPAKFPSSCENITRPRQQIPPLVAQSGPPIIRAGVSAQQRITDVPASGVPAGCLPVRGPVKGLLVPRGAKHLAAARRTADASQPIEALCANSNYAAGPPIVPWHHRSLRRDTLASSRSRERLMRD